MNSCSPFSALDQVHVVHSALQWRRAIRQWARKGYEVGYADREPDPHPALESVLAGARLVLKGLTLNRSLGGPAHQDSLYPHELAGLVDHVRTHEAFLAEVEGAPETPQGEGLDEPDLRYAASVVARLPLKAGRALRSEDLKDLQSTLQKSY